MRIVSWLACFSVLVFEIQASSPPYTLLQSPKGGHIRKSIDPKYVEVRRLLDDFVLRFQAAVTLVQKRDATAAIQDAATSKEFGFEFTPEFAPILLNARRELEAVMQFPTYIQSLQGIGPLPQLSDEVDYAMDALSDLETAISPKSKKKSANIPIRKSRQDEE